MQSTISTANHLTLPPYLHEMIEEDMQAHREHGFNWLEGRCLFWFFVGKCYGFHRA